MNERRSERDNHASVRCDGEVLVVSGRITLDTVPELLAAAAGHIASGVRRIDFAAATEVDSAAVALALEWQRQASGAGHALALEHLPQAMQNLARLYGVSDLLRLDGG
jgi:phospholipid transport system transporter-binding protein